MPNEKIISLANELLDELIKSGYDVRAKGKDGIIPGFLRVDIDVFDHGKRDHLVVQNMNQGWEIGGKCTISYPADYLEYLNSVLDPRD